MINQINKFKVGDKILNNDQSSWYFGVECVIDNITHFPAKTGFNKDDLVVYTVSVENISFSTIKVAPVG
jgi:hypothetical protein